MQPIDATDIPEIDMPIPRRMPATMKLLFGVLATVGGWAVTSAATHVWNYKANQADLVAVATRDSVMFAELRAMIQTNQLTTQANQLRFETKLDSANLRLTQLKCGRLVDDGCR